LPPEAPRNAFEHTAENRAGANSLYDCFHNATVRTCSKPSWSCAQSPGSTIGQSR
jgi:hypothetical protein